MVRVRDKSYGLLNPLTPVRPLATYTRARSMEILPARQCCFVHLRYPAADAKRSRKPEKPRPASSSATKCQNTPCAAQLDDNCMIASTMSLLFAFKAVTAFARE